MNKIQQSSVSRGQPKAAKKSLSAGARILVFSMLLCINWALSAGLLWWLYDFTDEVRGGHYAPIDALSLVIKMGLLITCLISLVWVLTSWRGRKASVWELWWVVGGETGLLMAFYLSVIMVRRFMWTEARGISNWAMFFGDLNATFISGSEWLIFLLGIIPCVSVVSAILFCIQEHVIRSAHRAT